MPTRIIHELTVVRHQVKQNKICWTCTISNDLLKSIVNPEFMYYIKSITFNEKLAMVRTGLELTMDTAVLLTISTH